MKGGENILSASALLFQVLAWLEGQDVSRLLASSLQRSECSRQASARDLVQRVVLDRALARLDDDALVNPALLALARCRLTQMHFPSLVSSAMDGALDAPSSLGALVEAFATSIPAAPSAPDETKVFCAAIAGSRTIDEYLKRMSQSWQGDACLGAQNLRFFFFRWLDLLQWDRPMPLFLHALLQNSLSALDWHLVAAGVMRIAFTPCQCAAHLDSLIEARLAWLAELCWAVKEIVWLECEHLPQALQANAETFEDTCISLYEAFDQTLREGKGAVFHQSSSSCSKPSKSL